MAITYPISLPSTPGPRTLEWTPVAAVARLASPFTFQQQIQAHQGQLWRVRITLPPMAADTAEEWIAALLSLNGMQGSFLFGDSVRKTPRGVATGTPLVKGAGQSGQTLVTDGWSNSITGILKRGDWIQLGSGASQRAYKVLADANSNGSGEATFDIWPRLRESPADNAPLTIANTKMCMRLADNVMDYSVSVAKHYGFEIDAIEALGVGGAAGGGASSNPSATGTDSIALGSSTHVITHNLGNASAFIVFATANWNSGAINIIAQDADTITIQFANDCTLNPGSLNWSVST